MPRTLSPELIIAGKEELCDLSYKFRPTLYASDQKSPIVSYGYSDSEQKVFRFPPNTKGYFYFHRSPDLPELLWGVRFRICDGPEDFERGHDLLSRSGTPWGYTVIALVYDSFRRPFLELAEAEHFIEEDLVRDIKKLGLDDARRMASFLYSLADPFILNLAKPKVIVTIITRKRVATVRFLTTRFAERRKSKDGKMQKPIYPLIGSIKVQLELSTLPEHKSLGPTLVFRILEVIEPVTVNPDYTVDPSYTESTVALPEPGTLMYRLYKGERRIVKIPIRRQKMGADILKLANEAWPTAVL
ncbi:hypothetical protein BDN70DRAFT_931174 [Pholiota conissans]|uniref:Uncharacterized protein n=1 Tax=Pholiota conissans TaxID=109636 RepID=A0A9P5Z432_9AGAR|nr:hypothetical protein BDN70DRAFT_931174 [Pholiota conissans]